MEKNIYYSVKIPYVSKGATEWHPISPTGPFSVLVRGAFKTEEDAQEWGEAHLAGHPFTIVRSDT